MSAAASRGVDVALDLTVDAQQFPGTLSFLLPPPLFPEDLATQAKGFSLRSNDLVTRWRDEHAVAAERLFHEANYPEAQFTLLVEAMEAVAGHNRWP